MAGTAKTSEVGWVAWEAEDSFADSADDTYTDRMQIRDATVDLSGLNQTMLDLGGAHQRMNERDLWVLGAFGADSTFTTTFPLEGHGSTTAGSLTETDLSKLLAQAIGATDWTQVGTAAIDAGSDADTIVDAEATVVAGGLMRVGDLGDTRGEGQAAAISSTNGTTHELLTAVGGSASAGDNFYAMGMVYPSTESNIILTSDGSANNNSVRMVLATENQAFICRGCACTGVDITGLNPGELPQITLTWTAAAFGPGTPTHPSATATDAKTPVVSSTGSVFIQTVGTTTRATVVPLEISLSVGHGMTPRMGPGGANTGQNVVGWVRTPAETRLTLVIESEAQTGTPAYWLSSSPTTARHILITNSTVDGGSTALYLPRCIQVNNPTQTATNGLNTYTIEFVCATGATTTSDLTLSPWRLGMG